MVIQKKRKQKDVNEMCETWIEMNINYKMDFDFITTKMSTHIIFFTCK